jgi:hypothetical protein
MGLPAFSRIRMTVAAGRGVAELTNYLLKLIPIYEMFVGELSNGKLGRDGKCVSAVLFNKDCLGFENQDL